MVAPPPMAADRLPPVPAPKGVAVVSPCTNSMSSRAQPRCSATSCDMVVARLCPWSPLPMRMRTLPPGSTRMVACSVAREAHAMPEGSTYELMPNPEVAALFSGLLLAPAEFVVVHHRRGLVQALPQRHVLVHHPGCGCVGKLVSSHRVAASQLERVEVQFAGHVVHHLLTSRGLRHPGPSIRRPADGVGVRRPAGKPIKRDAVRPGKKAGQVARRAAVPAHRVGADIFDMAQTTPKNASFGVQRHRHFEHLRPSLIGRGQILAAVLDPLDRPAQVSGGQHYAVLISGDHHLLAEPAADIAHAHMNVVVGDPEEIGEVGVVLVGVLRRHPGIEGVGERCPAGDDAARLHRRVGGPRLGERAGHDMGCRLEHRVELGRVGGRHRLGFVGVPFGVDQIYGVFQRRQRPDYWLLRLDVHLDQIGCIPCGIRAVGHHHRDGFADIADIPFSKSPQRRIGHLVADQRHKHRPSQPIQLRGGQHIEYPWLCLGRLGVDAPNQPSRHAAADEPGMQHARHPHVVDVGAPPGGEPPVFSTKNALSDEPSGAHGVIGPDSRRRPAEEST